MARETVIGLDASSGGAAVAALTVGANGSVLMLAARAASEPARPAAQLVPLLQRILEDADLKWDRLSAVAVAVGPGSYAGVRSAVVTAKSLAYALGRPLVAVGSLEAMAFWAESGTNPVWAALPARRDRVYAAKYRWDDGGLVCTQEASLWPRAVFWQAVLASPRCRVVGPPDVAPPTVLAQTVGDGAQVAVAVAHLGFRRWSTGLCTDPMRLVPTYVSLPEIGPPSGS